MRGVAAALLALLPFAAAAQQPSAPVPAPPPGTAAPGAPGTPPPAPTETVPPPNVWLPRPAADLIALDKISARPTPLTVKVGQSASFGSLTITVRACVVRPPDQAPDAAAFLDITDSQGGAPDFHGWMVLSDPSLAIFQHPVYDIRLAGCQN